MEHLQGSGRIQAVFSPMVAGAPKTDPVQQRKWGA